MSGSFSAEKIHREKGVAIYMVRSLTFLNYAFPWPFTGADEIRLEGCVDSACVYFCWLDNLSSVVFDRMLHFSGWGVRADW